ncbi:MAG: hypothetical protein MUD12_12870 [Spirochaetes bacterium]|jgi:hypothetical protein|nr:hypothetical protein [Spirochaetota bacterium]
MRKALPTLMIPIMALCASCVSSDMGMFGGSLKKSYSGQHSTVSREVPDAKRTGNQQAVADERPARDERPGVVVGRVLEVNRATNEITVRQNRDVMMGSIVYVMLDDREIMMTVTFPMQSIFKCVLAPNYRNRAAEIKKDMTVFLKQ